MFDCELGVKVAGFHLSGFAWVLELASEVKAGLAAIFQVGLQVEKLLNLC